MTKEDMDVLRENINLKEKEILEDILTATKVLICIVLSGSLLNENSPLSTVQLDAVYFMHEMFIMYFGYIMLGILFLMGDLHQDRIDYDFKDLKKEEYLFEAQDEVEESVFDYYKQKMKDETLNSSEKQSVIDETDILISKYRKYGLKCFDTKNKVKVTGVFDRDDSKSYSFIINEYRRLCYVKVSELYEQRKKDELEAKHIIDKLCIKSAFWDDLYDLEQAYSNFRTKLHKFDTEMKVNDLSANQKLVLSSDMIRFMNESISKFKDTDKFVEIALQELSNYKITEEKVSVMETA